MEIKWAIEGEVQLSRKLRGMVTDLKDFSAPFQTSANKLVSIYSKDVFSTKGQAINERWARLSPRTVAQKARRGFGTEPLVRTGRMQRSFKSVVSTDQAIITNDMDYFQYHQSNRPRKVIPRRPMMKLANPQKEMVVRIFQAYLRKVVSK